MLFHTCLLTYDDLLLAVDINQIAVLRLLASNLIKNKTRFFIMLTYGFLSPTSAAKSKAPHYIHT
uniref:Uncharacterized protein n=1 Tax=Thermosporothrix sp. COM3 TaxID=2490863 RepID=A0A455SVQ9_9CHLR|nr:hypothetical protein KTC_64070 [Thermosporothrix sp. COM3]